MVQRCQMLTGWYPHHKYRLRIAEHLDPAGSQPSPAQLCGKGGEGGMPDPDGLDQQGVSGTGRASSQAKEAAPRPGPYRDEREAAVVLGAGGRGRILSSDLSMLLSDGGAGAGRG